jgi:hypothetical protein
MPKLFPINIEVEELAVGRVMRMLNGMPGVAKMHLDMGHDKKPKLNGDGTPRGPYKTRKPAVQLEETGEEAVAKALFGKPPQTAKQIKDLFTSQGRSAASTSSVLYTMKANGDVQIGDDGYTLTKKMRDRMRHRKAAKSKKK